MVLILINVVAQLVLAQGQGRVDFDDRLVQGQRQGTGAVYIFERQKVELPSMLRRPRSFRERIIRTVFAAPK